MGFRGFQNIACTCICTYAYVSIFLHTTIPLHRQAVEVGAIQLRVSCQGLRQAQGFGQRPKSAHHAPKPINPRVLFNNCIHTFGQIQYVSSDKGVCVCVCKKNMLCVCAYNDALCCTGECFNCLRAGPQLQAGHRLGLHRPIPGILKAGGSRGEGNIGALIININNYNKEPQKQYW